MAAPVTGKFEITPISTGVTSNASTQPRFKAPRVSSVLARFLQRYAIQTLFVVAAILVLTSVRNLIACDTVGTIVIPPVPIVLTWMFWGFGQRTRDENSCAAFIYHAVAVALTTFIPIAIHRFWLGGHLLGLKPLYLIAAGIAAISAGILFRREHRIPYLHQLMISALNLLFAGLQVFRLIAYGAHDFQARPLPLFAFAYIVGAAICFNASRTDSSDAADDGLKASTQTPLPEHKEWNAAWRLWAHLCVASTLVSIGINARYYALTHRETVQRLVAQIERYWLGWLA